LAGYLRIALILPRITRIENYFSKIQKEITVELPKPTFQIAQKKNKP